MNPTIDDLLAQAERLSPEDREILLIRLKLAFGDTLDPDIEAAWIAEAQRRLDAVDRGESVPVPWEEVRKDLGLA
jgi:Putative addiction module component